jgi:two-component system heavy metal sensor histidine kinase CusS
MLDLTQRRLTVRFTLVLVSFMVLLICTSFLYFHQSIMDTVKKHLHEEILHEFVDQFNRSGLDTFKSVWEEFQFQILNRKGDTVIESNKARSFYNPPNKALLSKAFNGEFVYERYTREKEQYLIAYFPLSEEYAGRVAASLHTEIEYQEGFIKVLLMSLPLLLLASYLASRYMVKHAMKPISDAFTFQETFSSSVSHELRSPLASLKGNFEVTLRKDRPAAEYRETIESGLSEVDRIISLLNDLFLLASSRFKPLDLFREQINLKEMIEQIIERSKPRLEAKRIVIEDAISPKTICICDEALIRRVFENVLSNAVNYTPPGGVITVKGFEAVGKLLVNVSNPCSGITDDDAQYFFEPFARGKHSAADHREGKGLGLFISRYIVRSHGGDISVKIKDRTTFSLTVSLPLR